MNDIEIAKYMGIGRKKPFPVKKVTLTKNMSALIGTLLLSFKVHPSGLVFDPNPEHSAFIKTLTQYDLIDAFNRLGIDLEFYGTELSRSSEEYVRCKMVRLRSASYNDSKKKL